MHNDLYKVIEIDRNRDTLEKKQRGESIFSNWM